MNQSMNESFAPVLRTDVDVLEMWRRLMTPLGFSRPSVWLVLVGADDRPLPVIHECTDVETTPDAEEVDQFGRFLAVLLTELVPEGRIALLASRPGPGGVRPDDRVWAAGLYASGRQRGVPLEVVHLATDDQVLPVPFDDLDGDALTALPRPA